ncbi:MAG: IPT/TIG domain-containing protein [Chitinophagaceae bacterium]|nr:IPT/TIG domain-containing protein [Chitinophagaceae bacterium]
MSSPLRLGLFLFMFSLSFSSCKKDKEAPDVVISSFTDHGQGGTTISITGSGFSDKIAENTVTINDQPATVTAATTTALSVKVPAKAGSGKIKVSVGAKSSVSNNDFTYDWVHMVSTLTGDGTTSTFERPVGLATDGAGTIYFADEYKHKVFKITPDGILSTLAGSGTVGFKDGNGVNAQFAGPSGVTTDANGNVYVADRGNRRIRKITPTGDVSTWAGDGSTTNMDLPTGLCFDGAGNMIVADQARSHVIKITPNPDGSRTFSTVAGSSQGYADGNAATAKFNWLIDVAVDANGNIYVADQGNSRVRKITPAGYVTTIAGNGTSTPLGYPIGIDIDSKGNIYTADEGNFKIHKITITPDGTATLSTIAGIGESGYADGPANTAIFSSPLGLAFDKNGNMYIGDGNKPRIRKIVLQ